MFIELKNIQKSYSLGRKKIEALRGISLGIEKGSFIAIKGPSGSGKTTLLNILGALDTPDGGEFIFDNQDIAGLNKKKRLEFRAHNLGFIFQDFNLIQELNLYENIEIPLLIENCRNRKEKILSIINEVGLSSHIEHKPDELSGGQRQRVSIARALVKNPRLVIADEPTANLDSQNSLDIISLMLNLNKKYGTTFIIATHDVMTLQKVETIFNLIDGRLV